MGLTSKIQRKLPFTIDQLKDFLDKSAEARGIISKAKAELDAQKDAFKDLSESQNKIINECYNNYARGYAVELTEVTVVYHGNVAEYYDAKSGEKIEDAVPLVEGEQLAMTGGKSEDADSYLRRKSAEED